MSKLSFQQQKRIQRLNKERHYLLDISKSDTLVTYAVSGSTGNVYMVTIHLNPMDTEIGITCNCPDTNNQALQYNCLCKHCCFVLLKVLKLNEDSFYTALKEKHISVDTMTETICCETSQVEYYDPEYRERYLQMKGSITEFTMIHKDLTKEECPVCFDSFINDSAVSCPCCRNSIHNECMERWLQNHDTCVLCRSDVWKNYKTEFNVYK